jgi:hypothetical protein
VICKKLPDLMDFAAAAKMYGKRVLFFYTVIIEFGTAGGWGHSTVVILELLNP